MKPVCESVNNLDNVSVLDSVNRLLPIKYCQDHDHHCICHLDDHLDGEVLPVWPFDDPPVVHILVCVARHLVMKKMIMLLMMMTTTMMMTMFTSL